MWHLLPPWLLARRDVSPAAKLVWGAIASSGIRGNDTPTVAELAKALGMSEVVVRGAIARLERVTCVCGAPVLDVQERVGASNRYEVHSGARCFRMAVGLASPRPTSPPAPVVDLSTARRARKRP
jgi:hypothetical protein